MEWCQSTSGDPAASGDACSHGILQTTFPAANIEISGILPDLGAWCEQEGPTGMRWEAEEGWICGRTKEGLVPVMWKCFLGKSSLA